MKKSKKNKVNYNFPKETCELIAERDGNECLFCKMQYHMDKCRSEMLLGIPDIMHYINKSQGGLGIEENGVLPLSPWIAGQWQLRTTAGNVRDHERAPHAAVSGLVRRWACL